VADSRGAIEAVLLTCSTSKSAGPIAQAVDGIQTKAEFCGDFRSTPSGVVPLPSPFGARSRFEAMTSWIMCVLGTDDVTADDRELAAAFAARYNTSEVSYGGALKRELRRADKVAAGKTRLFMPGNIWDHCLATCLFGSLARAIHLRWAEPDSTIRVGCSVTGGNWDTLGQLHAARDISHSSDASGWDASIPGVLHGSGGSLMSRLIDPRFARIADEYVDDRIFALIIGMDGSVMRKAAGGSSGDKVTSDLNSIDRTLLRNYQLARWRQEYMSGLNLSLKWINECFTTSTFGDDCLDSFDRDDAFCLNEHTFSRDNCTRWAAELGISLEYVPVDEGLGPLQTFLSTSFVKFGGVYMPVSERPEKVIAGLRYSSIDFERDPVAAREQCHTALASICWHPVAYAWLEKLCRRIFPTGLHDRSEYRRRYYHGATEGVIHKPSCNCDCAARYWALRDRGVNTGDELRRLMAETCCACRNDGIPSADGCSVDCGFEPEW
jgi:hypothetical protein